MTREQQLVEFLRRQAGTAFVIGQSDCLLTVAAWVQVVTGIDLGAQYRGTYSTALGWRRVLLRQGGMLATVDRLLGAVGWHRAVDAGRPGDVGVIQVAGHGPAGALRARDRWVLKLDRGLTGHASPPVLACWSDC